MNKELQKKNIEYDDTLKTHRCEKSLKERMSIRYYSPRLNIYKERQWWLLKATEDFDWNCWYLNPVCPIQYCPFCGTELPEQNKERTICR